MMIFESVGNTIPSLLDGLIKGDEEKSRALFEWISPAIRANLNRRGFKNDDLDDVASEVYYKMVKDVRKPTYDRSKTRFRVLVGSCIKDVVVEELRKSERRLKTVPLVGEVEADKGWEEDYRVNLMNHGLIAVKARVEELTWLVVVAMKEGKKPAAIAAELGKTAQWVSDTKSRVMEMLREECKRLDRETEI